MITPEMSPVPVQPIQAKLPGPIALFKQAWQIYKSRFWLLIGISVIPMALIIILGLLAGGSALAAALLGVKASPALIIVLVILGVLVYLAVIYIALWSQAALLFAVKGSEQKVGFKESFGKASHKVFSILGAGLIVGLAVCGSMLLGGAIIFTLYAFVLPHTALFYLIEGILGLVLVLWIIKLGVEFCLASYVVVGDNAKALSAVQRSQDYIKGNWWKVFWRGLFIMVLFVLYYIVAGLIITALGKIPGAGGVIISQLVSLVASVVVSPFLVVYLYKIYENLRAIKGESQIPADKSSKWLIILSVVVVALFGVGILFGIQSAWKEYSFGKENSVMIEDINRSDINHIYYKDY